MRSSSEGKTVRASSARYLSLAIVMAATGGCAPSPAGSESITGCLNLRAGGQYILTEEKTARAVTVMAAGPLADLKPHGHNHPVTITGTLAKEQGREVFKASAIQHLDVVCS
jgi:hypothetical protein